MAVTVYIELLFSWLFRSFRGRDAKLFTRVPPFNTHPPTIVITSDVPNPMTVDYTQDGAEKFPWLSWKTPKGAAQLLLIVQDCDAPLPTPIVHGLYYGIPPTVQSVVSEDFENETALNAKGLKLGKAFRRGKIYSGPRPLLNHGPHRYMYQLIALAAPLEGLPENDATMAQIRAALKEDDIVAWGEWVGVAERKW